MYGMPQRRGRSRVDVKTCRRRRSSSHGGKRGVVPGPPVRSGVGASRDSISASPSLRRSTSRTTSRAGSNRRPCSGHRVGDIGDSSQRRRRRSRRAFPESQVQGQRQGHGRDDAASSLGDGASPQTCARREEVVAAASAAPAAGSAAKVAGVEAEQAIPFRDTRNSMEDHERDALLSSLSAAYNQVNDLTHELKISLDRLDRSGRVTGSDKDARPFDIPDVHKPPPLSASDLKKPSKDGGTEDAIAFRKRNALLKIFNEVLTRDEYAPSTPAAVRQLRVEVERLRQRNAQASAKEDEYKSDISNIERHIALLESKISKAGQDSAPVPNSSSCHTNTTNDNISSSSSRSSKGSCRGSTNLPPDSAYCTTPGGTRYWDAGETRSLVARVAELEAKLKRSSTENAKAKQALHKTQLGQHAAKLKGQKLEKSLQKLTSELVKSRAMKDCLQKEVDRLNNIEPEDNAQRSGWQRQWLNGLKEPLSPEPTPIKIHGPESGGYGSWRSFEASAPDSNPIQANDGNSNNSSPVVLVGDLDLDKNRLVYTTDRSQFVYLDYLGKK